MPIAIRLLATESTTLEHKAGPLVFYAKHPLAAGHRKLALFCQEIGGPVEKNSGITTMCRPRLPTTSG